MRMLARIVIGVLALCALGGCGDSSEQLIGQWELNSDRGPMVIEFRTDGTYSAWSESGATLGSWEIVGSSELATWARDDRPKRVNAFSIEDDVLIIRTGDGHERRHRRVQKP